MHRRITYAATVDQRLDFTMKTQSYNVFYQTLYSNNRASLTSKRR